MQKLSRRRVAEYAADKLMKNESPMKLATYLAAYLAENKQTRSVDMLMSDIKQVLATRHGVVSTDVTSAHSLSGNLRTAITKLVEATHQTKTVLLNESVDPELIGGVVVSTPQGHFDGSVRKKLQTLQAIKNKEI